MSHKVFILGLDGATFRIIHRLRESGSLPAFDRVMREGVWGELESVANLRSAAAWTTFQTGTNPGKHGIYEFYDYLPESYGLKFIHGGSRDGESFWGRLSRAGKQVVVMNVPMTFPAEPVNGCLIAGLDCPSTRSHGFTHPPELREEIHRVVGDYLIEPGLTGKLVGGKIDEAVDLIRREFEQKMALTRHLMDSHPWDFFTVCFRSLDAVQHCFWKFMDSTHPQHNPAEAETYGGVIDKTYRMIDSFLGELLERLDAQTTLLIMSDHGFGQKHAATAQINSWLASRGYLAFHDIAAAGGGWLRPLYRRVVGLTPRRVKERLWALFPALRDRVQTRLCFANIDWSRTRAYSDSLFANIRINVRGREQAGIVEPGDEYARLLVRLQEEANDLRDSVTGEPIVDCVLPREATYHGPHSGKAPDLLLRWREDIVIHGIDVPHAKAPVPASPPIPGEDPRVISGDHHLQGVFLGRGPELKVGSRIEGARLMDLAPTVLHLMNQPVPEEMDGQVLTAALTDDSLHRRPPVRAAATAERRPSSQGYSSQEEEEIHRRLRDLGYVE